MWWYEKVFAKIFLRKKSQFKKLKLEELIFHRLAFQAFAGALLMAFLVLCLLFSLFSLVTTNLAILATIITLSLLVLFDFIIIIFLIKNSLASLAKVKAAFANFNKEELVKTNSLNLWVFHRALARHGLRFHLLRVSKTDPYSFIKIIKLVLQDYQKWDR